MRRDAPPAWGEPPWGGPPEPARSPLPEHADVVVVGAGLTGLAAALELARAGASVAVLEASHVGAGASGRTGGLVLEGSAAGALDGTEACVPALAELVDELSLDCSLRLGGCWELAHRDAARPADSAGIAWRDGESVLAVESQVPGGTVDPAALLRGLRRAAEAAGAVVVEGVAVRRVAPGAGSLLDLGDREIACGQALLALNAYTRELLPEAADWRVALTLAIATRPLPGSALAEIGLGEGRPFYTVDRPYLWGRTTPDGGVVFGAGLASAPDEDPRRLDVGRGEAAGHLERLEARVRALHPALADFAVARRWGGPVAFRAGARPVLARHPADRRLLVTGAFAGHGVALGVCAGRWAARALAGERALPAWGALAAA